MGSAPQRCESSGTDLLPVRVIRIKGARATKALQKISDERSRRRLDDQIAAAMLGQRPHKRGMLLPLGGVPIPHVNECISQSGLGLGDEKQAFLGANEVIRESEKYNPAARHEAQQCRGQPAHEVMSLSTEYTPDKRRDVRKIGALGQDSFCLADFRIRRVGGEKSVAALDVIASQEILGTHGALARRLQRVDFEIPVATCREQTTSVDDG